MRRVQASCSGRASSVGWAFRPWADKLLTRIVASAARLVVAVSSRCSWNGSGGSGLGPHRGGSSRWEGSDWYRSSDRIFTASPQGRGVPEPGVDARPGGRPGENSLGFLLPGAGGFRRVLVPGVPGRDPAHPRGLPVGRPFLHGPLRALDRLSDDTHIDASGGVQDRFCFHPHQHMIVGTLPPPDQDGGLLRGDPDPHAPTASGTAQEIHEKHGSVSCQPYMESLLKRRLINRGPDRDHRP